MAGGGGAWKVAYADFVTAMMAFFMVMWLTSQKPEVKESIGGYFNDPWARSRLNSNRSRDPSLAEHKSGETDPKKKFRGSDPMLAPHDQPEAPDRKQPKLVTVRASERTAIGNVITFQEGSRTLDETGKEQLRLLIPKMLGLRNKVEVRSHTGLQAKSLLEGDDSAWDICYARAVAVMQFLEKSGIDSDRIRLALAGPYEPITLDTNPLSALRNMRVEVFLLDETVESLQGTPTERERTVLPKAERTALPKADEGKPHA